MSDEKKIENLEDIPKEVIDVVAKDADIQDEKLLEPTISEIKKEIPSFYSDIIFILTNLRFPEDAAKKHMSEILKHKYFVSEKLGRNIGVRVAAFDYFMNIEPKLKDITIVDIETYKETTKLAIYDGLTELYNRKKFDEILSEEIKKAKKTKKEFSLLLFDIDNFKLYNDTNGHLAGDVVLKRIARMIEENIREIDFPARWGGEEFAVVFPDTSKSLALEISEKIRNSIFKYEFPGDDILPSGKITITGGIATFPKDGTFLNELVNCADKLLYKAKSEGKNRIYG